MGFLDESSPQTTANTQRLWSFNKPKISKNTTKIKVNAFGFYSMNGNSVIDLKEHSKKEYVCEFLKDIKNKNPGKRIVVILDNFKSHRAKDTIEYAVKNEMELIYLPPYSPDQNPIEHIWKSIKRVISSMFIIDANHMKNLIFDAFIKYSSKISFAKACIEKFVDEEYKRKILGY